MIKYILPFILLSVAKATSCHQHKSPAIPACIERKIDSVKLQPKANPPAQVQQYTYNGKMVYLFTGSCCDQYNMVYDEQCNYICAPSGGLTGKGDRKCTDFNANAKLVKVIWKDER